MKRYLILKTLLKSLSEDDTVLFCGNTIISEVKHYSSNNDFIFLDNKLADISISFGIGLAMTTESKVYVVITDDLLQGNLDMLTQMAVSRLKNIFCIVINSGYYDDNRKAPVWLYDAHSFKGLIFNIGLKYFEFNGVFKEKVPDYKYIRKVFEFAEGPAFFNIDSDIGKNNKIEYSNGPNFSKE